MKQRDLLVALALASATTACDRDPLPTAARTPATPVLAAGGPTASSVTTWGGAESDGPRGAAVAADGSTYLAGSTTSFGPNASTALAYALKFDADGALVWQRTWDGPHPFFSDHAQDVAVAPDGSVYVVGTTLGVGGDALILKFGADGTLIWQQQWGGSVNDRAAEVAVAADGSVYVAGATRSFGAGEEDLLLLKLTPDGALVWQKTWGTAGNEEAQGLAVGPDGSVYVAGVAPRPDASFAFDAVVLKVDPAGSLVWQRAYSAGEVADARGGVAVGADGGVYVVGGFQAPSGSGFANDALLFKLAADGSLLWDRTWGGRDGDFAEGVAAAPNGTVAVVGGTSSFGQGSGEAFLLVVSADGRVEDASIWGGAGLEGGTDVAVAPGGTISLAAFVQAPPYVLDRAASKTSRARGVVTPSAPPLADAAGALADAGGVVATPPGSTTFAGGFDAALVRITP